MSMTTPFGSSVSARKAASITKVAPCNAWAGPNISPRNEWAIMMWSRTSTAYIGTSAFRGIIDELAQDAALGRQDLLHAHRQLHERARWREQGIQARVGEQIERGRDAARMNDEVAVARRRLGRREADAEGSGEARPLRRDIDQRHLGARQLAAQPSDQRAHHPGA